MLLQPAPGVRRRHHRLAGLVRAHRGRSDPPARRPVGRLAGNRCPRVTGSTPAALQPTGSSRHFPAYGFTSGPSPAVASPGPPNGEDPAEPDQSEDEGVEDSPAEPQYQARRIRFAEQLAQDSEGGVGD